MSGKGIGGGLVGAIAGFAVGGPIGAIAIGASGFSAGEALTGADKSVDAAKANRDLMNAQADEVTARAEYNRLQILGEGETNRGEIVGSTVRGGVDVSSQSTLVALENAKAKYEQQAYFQLRDAQMQANSMRAQAQMNVDAAKRAKQAAQIGAGVSVLGSAAQAYMLSTSSGAGGAKKPVAGTSSYGTAGGSYSDFSNLG